MSVKINLNKKGNSHVLLLTTLSLNTRPVYLIYRNQQAEQGRVEALLNQNRRVPNLNVLIRKLNKKWYNSP